MSTSDDPLWFPYTDKSFRIARKAVHAILGGGSIWKRLSALF